MSNHFRLRLIKECNFFAPGATIDFKRGGESKKNNKVVNAFCVYLSTSLLQILFQICTLRHPNGHDDVGLSPQRLIKITKHQTVFYFPHLSCWKDSLFELPLDIISPSFLWKLPLSLSSCLLKSLSLHFSNNDRVGGPLRATNKDRDRGGDPTVTFISKSRNPEPHWSLSRTDYVFFFCLFLQFFSPNETLSATVSTFKFQTSNSPLHVFGLIRLRFFTHRKLSW